MLSRMARNYAVCFLIAAVVAVVAGCDNVSGPEQTEVRGSGDTSVVSTSAPQPAPATPATTEALPAGTLPLCSQGSSNPLPDCRLQSKDGFAFEVRRSGTGRTGTLTIDVIAPNGTGTQTITEKDVELDGLQPSLRDTDADGRDELLVPLVIGPYWTNFAVYHASGEATEFTRAGEFTGLGINSTADGYTVTSGKLSGYQGWSHDFWIYKADKLIPIVTVEVHFLNPDKDGKFTGKECTVVDDSGLYRTDFASTAAAREHFCAEPAVVE